MLTILDTFSAYAGRVVALVALLLWALLALDWLLFRAAKHAGYIGLQCKFFMAEAAKSPRGLAARLFWGEKR